MGHLLVYEVFLYADPLICRDWWGHSTGYHPVQPRLPERALAKGVWKCKRSCEEDAWSQPLLSVDCPAGSGLVIWPHDFSAPQNCLVEWIWPSFITFQQWRTSLDTECQCSSQHPTRRSSEVQAEAIHGYEQVQEEGSACEFDDPSYLSHSCSFWVCHQSPNIT